KTNCPFYSSKLPRLLKTCIGEMYPSRSGGSLLVSLDSWPMLQHFMHEF
ncbi:25327_t:CDS:1, partial [Gigaspora rosea]